ncbi:HAD family hydrolase [Streptomyces sp. NPDC088354]|uniref:HAD family hydrolase n=1 Tax=unclassified Streptomyces TaxID=2593676 RepID=UPI0029BC00BC|nr:HAD family hydrolase [Streptomyces sp. MI02-7b]MDX3073571.1 HAD family hydrolase [Streptomyces sp. MI02-7b]
MIRAVVFDVGETLVDETEIWGSWADWLGVPRHTFSAVFGAMAARGREQGDAFRVFRPDFDGEAEERARAAAGRGTRFGREDLYPDVRPCIQALRDMGVWVGIAGNQPVRAERDLMDCELPVQMIATSAGWGVKKPDPAFFERIIAECPFDAREVVYVGDRALNDVVPAKTAGLATALIRRGVWGFVPDEFDPEQLADVRLHGLDELPQWVAARRRA